MVFYPCVSPYFNFAQHRPFDDAQDRLTKGEIREGDNTTNVETPFMASTR
jgi:hypothetical protein